MLEMTTRALRRARNATHITRRAAGTAGALFAASAMLSPAADAATAHGAAGKISPHRFCEAFKAGRTQCHGGFSIGGGKELGYQMRGATGPYQSVATLLNATSRTSCTGLHVQFWARNHRGVTLRIVTVKGTVHVHTNGTGVATLDAHISNGPFEVSMKPDGIQQGPVFGYLALTANCSTSNGRR